MERVLINTDELKGKTNQVKGAVKEQTRMLDDPDLQAEGEVEKTAGKIQEKVGTVRRTFDEAAKDK